MLPVVSDNARGGGGGVVARRVGRSGRPQPTRVYPAAEPPSDGIRPPQGNARPVAARAIPAG